MTTHKSFLIPVLFFLLFTGCKQGPKTAEPFPLTRTINKDNDADEIDRAMHEVLVKEILPASKYVYLEVREKGKEFWIAVPKQEIVKGNTYLYNEALLKTQFESKENDRVFDTLYLVTSLVSKEHGLNLPTGSDLKVLSEKSTPQKDAMASTQEPRGQFAGSIKIADLVGDPKKYDGKMVELSGECVKVNLNIMDRNWIHLKDGSKDDYDLVITTKEEVQKGDVITIKAIVALNKDFGSGYMYDIILENGILIN